MAGQAQLQAEQLPRKDGYTGFSSYDDYKADKDAQAAAATSKANREARHKAAQTGQGINTKSWTELQEEAKAAQKTTEQAAGAVSASSKKASSSAKKAASEVVNSITSTSTQIENGVTRTTETVNETLKNGTKQQKQTVTETSRQMVDGVLSDVRPSPLQRQMEQRRSRRASKPSVT